MVLLTINFVIIAISMVGQGSLYHRQKPNSFMSKVTNGDIQHTG